MKAQAIKCFINSLPSFPHKRESRLFFGKGGLSTWMPAPRSESGTSFAGMTILLEVKKCMFADTIVLYNLHYGVHCHHPLTLRQDDQRIDVDAVELIAEADGEV